MEYQIGSSGLVVSLTSSEINVNVGESAKIDVGTALNYIKSGEVEIDNYVNDAAKPAIDAYVDNTSKPSIDSYVDNTSKPAIDAYVVNTTEPNIDAYVTNTVLPQFGTYIDLAKDWATKTDGTVDGAEYSAKYYAEQAQTTLSSKQDILTADNAGTGISITGSGANVLISNTQTSAEWGNIGGNISDQTDLQNALNAKQDVISDLAQIRSGALLGSTAVQPNELATALTPYATQSWVENKGYLTEIPAEYVTDSELTAKGYITNAALVGYATESYVTTAVGTETTARQNADNNLQSQIDAITASSDVTDIVGTYAELQSYDTSTLPPNSIIKVLQDESKNNETTYYRWVITGGVGAWSLIGEEGPYYTISAADAKFATQTALSTGLSDKQDAISDLSTIRSNATNGASAYTTIQGYGNIVTHNVSEFATSAQGTLAGTALQPSDNISELNNDVGYITGISSSDVTSALGYTPQDTLVSGTNIKTINNVSLLGSGNLVIGGTIDTEISTTSTNAVQNKAIPNYIVSRGENLVTNGFASLGNNYNFKSFTFDGTDTYGAGGCFSYTSTPEGSRSSILSDELMPVDITQSYKLSYAVKNSTSTATYDYLNMYDIDGYQIAAGNVGFVEGTTTTLAQELKNGDTKIYLTNISDTWKSGDPSVGTNQYYRGLIFWNWQNSYGYQYPIEYYSRYWWYNLWKDDNDVDKVNGVITLKSAWNHGTFPAGTPVSQGTLSGGFIYGNSNYIPPMGEWTEKSFIFTPDRFRNGTSYIRLGWLYNYSQRPSNVFKISSVSLTQNLSIKDALKNTDYATTTVGGVVKVLSTYGTEINNGVVTTFKASNADIDAKTQQYRPIVPSNLDYAVKTGVTTNTITLTSTEQKAAQDWLGVTDLVGDVETLINAL